MVRVTAYQAKEAHEKMKVEALEVKKLMLLIAGGILSAALPLAADTETVGGYTCTTASTATRRKFAAHIRLPPSRPRRQVP